MKRATPRWIGRIGNFARWRARLIAQSRTRLATGGHLIVEIATAQERPAREKLTAIAEFALAPTIHDFSGHPRVLMCKITA